MEHCKFCDTEIENSYMCELCNSFLNQINENSEIYNLEVPASHKSIEVGLKICRYLTDIEKNVDIDIFEDDYGGLEIYMEYQEIPLVIIISSDGEVKLEKRFKDMKIDLTTKDGCNQLIKLVYEESLIDEE